MARRLLFLPGSAPLAVASVATSIKPRPLPPEEPVHPPVSKGITCLSKQTTISADFGASGKGLHYNSPVTVKVKPAPAYTGYVFRRSDLNDFEIPASPEHVAHVSYATTLMKSGVMIATVEHLLSALLGCGVDNATIEVDSLEVPILDGSSYQWVRLIEQSGVVKLQAPRAYLRVLK